MKNRYSTIGRNGGRIGIIGDQISESAKRKGLRPYLNPGRRPRPSFFRKWIAGGVPAIIWPYVLSGLLITLLWNLLWATETLPPTITPISTLWIGQVVFIIAIILGNIFLSGSSKYTEARRQWRFALNAIGTLAHDFVTLIDKDELCKQKQDPKILCALQKAMHYNRSISYAFKWDFRKQVVADLLPLPKPLAMRIRDFQSDDKVAAITRNLADQVNVLRKAGIVAAPAHVLVGKSTGDLSSATENINVTRQVNVPPAYRGHYFFVVSVYFVFLFLHMFPDYGWFDIGVVVYIIYAVLGLVLVSQSIKNPFDDPQENPFMTEVKFGKDADDVARESDAHYLQLFEDVGIQICWEDGSLNAMTHAMNT